MGEARETFERYLPYAIAFGVERDWVRRFHDLQLPAPMWYHPVFLPGYGGGWVNTAQGAPGTQLPGLPVGMPGGGGGLPGGGFNLDTISSSLFGSLNNLSSALTSAPTSTGSGRGAFGGGGGGFGGGFGGGGGGGGFGAG
jgi:hypothetical protein